MARDVRAAGLAAFIVLTKSPDNGSRMFLSTRSSEGRALGAILSVQVGILKLHPTGFPLPGGSGTAHEPGMTYRWRHRKEKSWSLSGEW